MSIKDSLVFILGRLEKLRDEERIRYEGVPVFEEARQELVSAIANYTEPTATPAPIVYNVMTGEQVMTVADAFNARISATERVIEAAISAESTASDAAVMGAIVEARGEVLAAIQAAPSA